MSLYETPITNFYANKSIFITGATGFIGKVLLEKLLRICTDIKHIYILIRPKNGICVDRRLIELKNDPIFKRNKNGAYQADNHILVDKIVAMEGDITLENFGLCQSDIDILVREVSVVFNSAATIKFNENLKYAIKLNVTSVLNLIQICGQMSKLSCLIHVSTAYSNCHLKCIEEKIYHLQVHPLKVLHLMDHLTDHVVGELTPHLIEGWPNTYTYSKAMAEQLLAENGLNLPICVLRPSIVGAAWCEPYPGWIDNYNGPTGVLAAMGSGLLKIMEGCKANVADLVPVDIIANAAITIPWYAAECSLAAGTFVFNCTSGARNKVTWGKICQHINASIDDRRTSKVVFVKNRALFHLLVNLKHTLPALVSDTLGRLLGKRPVLLKLYDKIHKTIKFVSYFTTNEWEFKNDRMVDLGEKLHYPDNIIFNIEIDGIDWEHYVRNYWLGTKRFLKSHNMKSSLTKVDFLMLRLAKYCFYTTLLIIIWAYCKNNF